MKNRVLTASLLLTLFTGSAAVAQNWIARDLGSPTGSLGVSDFDMPSSNVIWGINYDGTPAHSPVQDIFVSTNGGASWVTNTISTPSATGKDLANISGIDANTAFVAAYNPTAVGRTGNLFKTTNGGNSWTDVTIPTVEWLNFVHFFSPTEGMIMSDPDTQGYMIFRTTDGGTTWTRIPAASIPPPASNDYGLTNQFTALGDHVWFGTFSGQIYHSADRGQTWSRAASGFTSVPDTAAIRSISFTDADNGLVVNRRGRIRRTADGGATWTPVTPTGPFFGSNLTNIPGQPGAYVSTGSNFLEALGSSVSYDHGQTWALLDTAIQQTAVIFYDRQHGWAGGFTSPAGTGGVYEYVGQPLATASEINRPTVTVFPNPTTGLVRLSGGEPRETVTVIDVTGRVLRRTPMPASGLLDLSGLDAGVYQLNITGGRTPRTSRIAVEH